MPTWEPLDDPKIDTTKTLTDEIVTKLADAELRAEDVPKLVGFALGMRYAARNMSDTPLGALDFLVEEARQVDELAEFVRTHGTCHLA